jgi:predicted DNA-binding transcriptional regulator AlpA
MWPDYLKLRTLAKRLDLEVGAVEQLVARGLLPPPVKVGDANLWRWSDVDSYLRLGKMEPADDPYMRGLDAGKAPATRLHGAQSNRPPVLVPRETPRD